MAKKLVYKVTGNDLPEHKIDFVTNTITVTVGVYIKPEIQNEDNSVSYSFPAKFEFKETLTYTLNINEYTIPQIRTYVLTNVPLTVLEKYPTVNL